MRYILNVTSLVQPTSNDEWMKYLRTVFIPKSKGLSGVSEVKLLKVHAAQESGDLTYSVQISTNNPDVLQDYNHKIYPVLKHETATVFGEKVMLFATILEHLTFDE